MNLLGSFDRFVAICDDAGIIISLLLVFSEYRNYYLLLFDITSNLLKKNIFSKRPDVMMLAS